MCFQGGRGQARIVYRGGGAWVIVMIVLIDSMVKV